MNESPPPTPITTPTPETVSGAAVPRPEPAAPPLPGRQRSPLAVLGAAGFLLTAVAVLYLLWQQQQLTAPPAADPARVAALEADIRGLQQRDGQLEQRLRMLEQRPPPAPAADLGPLEGRVAALEQRPAQTQAPPDSRVDALMQRVAQDEAQVQASNDRVARLQRVQAATVALDAGQPLGPIANAPPALARFATTPPPTLADLRLSFAEASRRAEAASESDAGNGSVWQRMLQRAESLVTVREGNKVIVGPPAAPVLAEARGKLEAGDLAGGVAALDSLDGAAKAAMGGWRGQAQSLLDARAALTAMARG